MQTCHVRPATERDAPVSIAVLRRSIAMLCGADHGNDPVTLERWLRNKTEPSFIGWLADSSRFVAVAQLDAIVRGVGMIDTSGDVRLCYVEPGFQRRGIGRTLLLALEQRARQWGLPEVRLRSSVGAREFYERHGYASSGAPEQAFGVVAGYPYTKDIRSLPTSNTPRIDADIAAYTIGERKPHDDVVTLSEYDPVWPAMFERESQRIRHALGTAAEQLEHVGSTAVPGLAAKPLIDILLVVRDSSDEPTYVPALTAAGYSLRIREPNWFEHRLLTRPDIALNLHVFSIGCEEIERMLAFRDHLRAHAGDRALYERVKRELVSREWRHVQDYADAKAPVVEEILARAKAGGRS